MDNLYNRSEFVTVHVSGWICNDRELIGFAKQVALGGPKSLRGYIEAVLYLAPKHSTPWVCAQELAPNDFSRIDYQTIIDDMERVT